MNMAYIVLFQKIVQINHMKILAFDTCNAILSVAIMDGGIIIYQKIINEHSKQAEQLIPLINKSMDDANFKLSDMDYIAVSIGPGSFTGVRIGLSAAFGLSLVTEIPIIAITCLEALAFEHNKDLPIYVLMNARGDMLYSQIFKNFKPITEPKLLSIEHARENIEDKMILVGDGCQFINEKINPYVIDATMIACAAYKKLIYNLPMNDIAPLYIREANAKKNI